MVLLIEVGIFLTTNLSGDACPNIACSKRSDKSQLWSPRSSSSRPGQLLQNGFVSHEYLYYVSRATLMVAWQFLGLDEPRYGNGRHSQHLQTGGSDNLSPHPTSERSAESALLFQNHRPRTPAIQERIRGWHRTYRHPVVNGNGVIPTESYVKLDK
jgi:hypothetical protein